MAGEYGTAILFASYALELGFYQIAQGACYDQYSGYDEPFPQGLLAIEG